MKKKPTMPDYDLRWTDEAVGMIGNRSQMTRAGDFEPGDWALINALAETLCRYVARSARLSVRKEKGQPWEIIVGKRPPVTAEDLVTACSKTLSLFGRTR